jgi:hypothetical protein
VAAEIGTADDVPAATLLLPYFECALGPDLVPVANGDTTLFSINNASATAVLAHVTLWTDESVPTLDFDVYLTGYDVQTINVCDIFNGRLPVTASVGQDTPQDSISPHGDLSQDINFASCNGRLPYTNPAVNASLLSHIRNAHTGQFTSVYGGCSGFDHGDTVARGYITVDTTTQCSLDFPSSPGYISGVASYQNVLWGDYFYVDPTNNFANGETLVHIEACNAPTFIPPYLGFIGLGGTGVNTCGTIGLNDYTFYGRYVSALGTDQREALSTTFASRYLNGANFTGGTDLIVWRDSKTTPTGDNGLAWDCDDEAGWFPLNQADVVAFDEQENSTDLCFQGDNISPPTGGADTCFPLEAQRVSLQGNNTAGDDPIPPYTFGWIFLNLNTTVAGGLFNPTAQAWVETIMDANGLYSVGFDAIKLDQANQTFQSAAPGGVLLLP